jgi:hypothetical protein
VACMLPRLLKRGCKKDDECGDGFCDRGRCAAIWTYPMRSRASGVELRTALCTSRGSAESGEIVAAHLKPREIGQRRR